MDEQNLSSCICCRRSLRRIGGNRRRSISLTAEFIENKTFLMAYLAEVVNIREFQADRIYRMCFRRAERYNENNVRVAQNSPTEHAQNQPAQVDEAVPSPHGSVRHQATQVDRPQTITLPGYTRAPYNTHLCIFETCSNTNLQRISVHMRALILEEKSFYIPRGCRVCEEHLLEGNWQSIDSRCRRIFTEFSSNQLKEVMDILRTKKVFLDFDRISSIDDDVFRYYIGWTKTQFNEILQCTPSILQKHKLKAGRALATVLAKLHTGESNERLSTIFKMSRRSFERTMRLVRKDLTIEFVPRHLGYDHMSREEIKARCLSIPNFLYGNAHEPLSQRTAIVILYGTYIYLQKSSNYYFQRKSYSLHKYRHLLKPFLIVCPDGHILDIYGMYEATKSDATILSEIMKSQTDPFHWFFEKDDVLILDRGFRDCIEEVESCGYRAYMPSSKDDEETQLTTQQANDSRKVTLSRWVVETINGRLKNQFRQFRSQNCNRAATHLMEEIRIAGALLNAFGKPLTDHRLVNEIINEIPRRSGSINLLADFVIANNLNRRRAHFEFMSAEVPGVDDFPILLEDDLIIYALGTYQIAQARSYYGEYIKQGTYLIEVYKDLNNEFLSLYPEYNDSWILRGRIKSRHVNRRVYYVYILIKNGVEGLGGILGNYCTCIVGKRTLGCAHVMSIIWFLGWARYQDTIAPPAEFLDLIIRNEVEIEVAEDTDNDN